MIEGDIDRPLCLQFDSSETDCWKIDHTWIFKVKMKMNHLIKSNGSYKKESSQILKMRTLGTSLFDHLYLYMQENRING